MKIFDLHADIGDDVYHRHLKEETSILVNQHVEKLQKGEIHGVCMASYFEGSESWEGMQAEVLTLATEIKNAPYFHQVLSGADFTSEKPLAMMSLEGMCGILDDESEKLDWLYAQGIRLASFTWNEENALATGLNGDSNRGLTVKGKNVLYRMNQLKMIVDVSHANEKTFWDIMNLSKGLVIASHSNAQAICNHRRNLNDEQCLAIAQKGGLIGLNSAGAFIDEKREKQTAEGLAKHAAYLKDLVGIESIACGFDFMDFFGDADSYLALDLKDASQAQSFVIELRKLDFSETEIKKICYQNVFEKFQAYL